MMMRRPVVAAAGIVLTVFTVLRARALTLPLWWDEAFTVQRYVREGPGTILNADAYVANNHVAFSFLTWVTTRFFGEGDVALRLMAFIPALVAVILILRYLTLRSTAVVAVIAGTLITTSTLWLTLSTQARGYGLVLLASTVMLLTVVNHDRRPRAGHDVTFAVAGGVAILTFPPAVAVYLAHAGMWLWRRPTRRMRLVIATASTGLVTALVYLPIIPLLLERSDRVGSRFAEPISWLSPILAPLQIAGGPSFGFGTGLGLAPSTGPVYLLFGRPLSFGVGTATGIAAALVGVLGLVYVARRHSGALGAQLIAGLGGSIVLLAPFGFHLADRYLSFLLVHVLIAMTFGVAALLGVFAAKPRINRAVVACLVALGLALPVTWPTANIPVQSFRPAALDALEARRDGAQLITDQYHVGFRVYLPGIPVERAADQQTLDTLVCFGDGPRVYLRNPDVDSYRVPACLANSEPVSYRQQREPGQIDVWYLPADFAPTEPRRR